MIERIMLVMLLTVVAVGGYYALRTLHIRRMRPEVVDTEGQPALLYFRGESCAVCPTQSRVVDQLAEQWHDRLRIERIDAEREPERTAQYRVFSLPTTILVDGHGQVRHVNYGLADAHKLARQITSLNIPRGLVEQVGAQIAETAPTA